MTTAHKRSAIRAAALAAACLLLAAPRGAAAGGDPQLPAQPPPAQGNVVIEQVHNGPAFGVEVKFTEFGGREAYLFGGYAGVVFDGKLFIGGAAYVDPDGACVGVDGGYYAVGGCFGDYDPYDDYGDWQANAYGGLVVEWFMLRAPAVSLSARGLIGGGVATVGYDDYYYLMEPRPEPHHGSVYPPPGGYYYPYDEGYFVFEPQLNVTVRLARGVALAGGVGYRVIGWANGWEDQIQGLTGTFAIRFGGGR